MAPRREAHSEADRGRVAQAGTQGRVCAVSGDLGFWGRGRLVGCSKEGGPCHPASGAQADKARVLPPRSGGQSTET